MNIESANLTATVTTSSPVASVSQSMAEGGPGSDGFSAAFVTQLGLLSNIKMGETMPIPDIVGLQGAAVEPVVAGVTAATVETQTLAALLGNTLPPSCPIKDVADHQAALAAVTGAWKYIATGTTSGETSAESEKNLNDVIAMTIPLQQNVKDPSPVIVPVPQNIQDLNGITVPAQKNSNAVATIAVPTEQIQAAMDQQSVAGVAKDIQVQLHMKPVNDKSGKKQDESAEQMSDTGKVQGTDGLAPAIILPAVLPIEQGTIVNNPTPSDVTEQQLLLSFISLSGGNGKPNQSPKAPDTMPENAILMSQPVQDKQVFSLQNTGGGGQAEKAGLLERQGLNVEGSKPLSGTGVDLSQLNKPGTDNKVDIPAITKPLAHPEWNKELSERIVWMSSKAIPTAEIRLNPEHLGPISVRVNVADDQATVVFTAQHALTREALEASIPKLREMMSSQQLNLVDVSVGSASDQGRSPSQNFAQTAEGRGQGATGGVAADGIEDVEQEVDSGRAVVSKGLLSIYA